MCSTTSPMPSSHAVTSPTAALDFILFLVLVLNIFKSYFMTDVEGKRSRQRHDAGVSEKFP